MFFSTINGITAIIARFSPSKPFYNQLFDSLSSKFISILLNVISMSLLLGIIYKWKNKFCMPKNLATIISGFSIGMMIMGIKSFLYFYKPSLQPVWPTLDYIANYIPSAAITLEIIVYYSLLTSVILVAASALSYLSEILNDKKIILHSIFVMLFVITAGVLKSFHNVGWA